MSVLTIGQYLAESVDLHKYGDNGGDDTEKHERHSRAVNLEHQHVHL